MNIVRRLASRHRIRLAVAAAATLVTISGLLAAPAAQATASARSAKPAIACGNGVVVSMPLKNTSTGQSSWNYGYVQLWYDYCTGYNWGRTVSLLGGTTYIDSIVYNTAHTHSPWSTGKGTVITSGQIYSPSNPAGAFGDVVAGGVFYYAESDQAGANCQQDGNNGWPCPL